MMKQFWRRLVALLTVGMLMLVAACSSAIESPSVTESVLAPSLVALFQQQLNSPDASDFEREVFDRAVRTGGIAQEDYEEGFRRFSSCMVDAGYEETYEKRPDGIYERHAPQKVMDGGQAETDAYAQTAGECADGTVMRIESLYNEQLNNPGLLSDSWEVAVACLVRTGVVTADYKPEQLEKDYSDGFSHATFDPSDPTPKQCLDGAALMYESAEN